MNPYKTCPICSTLYHEATGHSCDQQESALDVQTDDVRSHNIGASNYAQHKIQPWDIWLEYKLNPWDADIIKRILRTKETDSRKLDYEKIIHICQERIRQITKESNGTN